MDFFIMLCSIAGIIGNAAQSNYAASCTVQDSLERQRTSCGEKAVSFDLGWMRHIGILAESKLLDGLRRRANDVREVYEAELLALHDIYFELNLQVLSESKSQLVVGAMTSQHREAMDLDPTAVMKRPFYAFFSQSLHAAPTKSTVNARDEEKGQATLFRQAMSIDERSRILSKVLAKKLAVTLSVLVDDIELTKPLSHYGVDSLMTIELHNWIFSDFQASISTFELMREPSIAAVGYWEPHAPNFNLGWGNKDGETI